MDKKVEECFNRICAEAKWNEQPVPQSFLVEGTTMYCEREIINPVAFAEFVNGKWIAFWDGETN